MPFDDALSHSLVPLASILGVDISTSFGASSAAEPRVQTLREASR